MSRTKMIRTISFAVVTLLLAMPALAQDSPVPDATIRPRATIMVTVDGLSCTTSAGSGTFSALTWNFGATQTSTGSGANVGKPTLSNLNITKRADACSPALFAALVTSKAFKSVTVVQQNSNKEDVFTVTLGEVFISSYQLEGDSTHELPTEQISFTFSKITFTDPQSGAKFAWDTTTNSTF
jgi:type VI secretion system Hcp family effector